MTMIKICGDTNVLVQWWTESALLENSTSTSLIPNMRLATHLHLLRNKHHQI